jgi:hypothetical protein
VLNPFGNSGFKSYFFRFEIRGDLGI